MNCWRRSANTKTSPDTSRFVLRTRRFGRGGSLRRRRGSGCFLTRFPCGFLRRRLLRGLLHSGLAGRLFRGGFLRRCFLRGGFTTGLLRRGLASRFLGGDFARALLRSRFTRALLYRGLTSRLLRGGLLWRGLLRRRFTSGFLRPGLAARLLRRFLHAGAHRERLSARGLFECDIVGVHAWKLPVAGVMAEWPS